MTSLDVDLCTLASFFVVPGNVRTGIMEVANWRTPNVNVFKGNP